VLVVDSGEPRNAPAAGIHNFLGMEGVAPAEAYRRGREEAARYGVRTVSARVVAASTDPIAHGDPLGFVVTLDSGETARARRLVIASGSVDVLPDIPGLAEQWGHGVVHCPFCHGWEVRDTRIGVLMTSPMGVHQAHLFRSLSDDVTVFVTDPAFADEDARARFAARGMRVVDGAAAEVLSTDGRLSGVTLADGRTFDLDALAAASTVEARVDFMAGLGITAADQRAGDFRIGTVLEVNTMGETGVRGVYAAGNLTNATTIVVAAAAAGTQVGAAVHGDLVQADIAAAIAESSRAPLPSR
jgi:thioredoxin reductase (NADPH)